MWMSPSWRAGDSNIRWDEDHYNHPLEMRLSITRTLYSKNTAELRIGPSHECHGLTTRPVHNRWYCGITVASWWVFQPRLVEVKVIIVHWNSFFNLWMSQCWWLILSCGWSALAWKAVPPSPRNLELELGFHNTTPHHQRHMAFEYRRWQFCSICFTTQENISHAVEH